MMEYNKQEIELYDKGLLSMEKNTWLMVDDLKGKQKQLDKITSFGL